MPRVGKGEGDPCFSSIAGEEHRRIIAVDSLPLEYESLRPHLEDGCLLHLEVGPRGNRLRKPIFIPLEKASAVGSSM
jgi:hypothetical protein